MKVATCPAMSQTPRGHGYFMLQDTLKRIGGT